MTDNLNLHNIEAERHVLGACLIDPDAMTRVRPMLNENDFFRGSHQTIYAAMSKLMDDGQPVEYIGLIDELEKRGALEQIGGTVVLTELLSGTPTGLYATHYAQIVANLATLRRAVMMAQNITEKAFCRIEPMELYAYVQDQLKILQPSSSESSLLRWSDSFDYYREVLVNLQEQAKAGPSPWRWPWSSWNRKIAPLQPSLPLLISADSDTGKTVYMENLAEWWAIQGLNIVYAHSELSTAVMQHRRMTRHSGIPLSDLLIGNVSESDLIAAEERLKSWEGNIHYLHTPGWNVDQLCSEVEILRQRDQCDILIFDYLDKLDTSPRQRRDIGTSYQLRAADDIERLKTLSERINIGLVTAAQLNKNGKRSTFKALSKSDIGESGQRVNKVNIVALLHREIMDEGMTDPQGNYIVEPGGKNPLTNVKIAKNTLGPTGTIQQMMDPPRLRVGDKANV